MKDRTTGENIALTRVFYHDTDSKQLDSFDLMHNAFDKSMARFAKLLQRSSGGSVGPLAPDQWKDLVVDRLTQAIGYGSVSSFTLIMIACSYHPSDNNVYTLAANDPDPRHSLDDISQQLAESLRPRSHGDPPSATLSSSVYRLAVPLTFSAFTLNQDKVDEALPSSWSEPQRKPKWSWSRISKKGKQGAAEAARLGEATTKILDLVNAAMETAQDISDMSS